MIVMKCWSGIAHHTSTANDEDFPVVHKYVSSSDGAPEKTTPREHLPFLAAGSTPRVLFRHAMNTYIVQHAPQKCFLF